MSTTPRVETIDIFRGLAVLLVVLFHFTARLPNHALNITEGAPWAVHFGWVGGYFFFMISGYCIFMTLERSATVSVFLARRFSRLYPAFAAAVILLYIFTLIANVPSVPEAKYRAVPAGPVDVVMNLLFLGELGEWVNGSFWSIAAELKFYLLVAIIWAYLPNKTGFTRVFATLAMVMAPIWAISTLFSGGGGSYTPQSLLKFLTIAPYLPFFAIGILGRQIQTGEQGNRGFMIANLALALLVVGIESYTPGAEDAVLVAITSMVVFAALTGLFLAFVSGHALPQIPFLSAGLARVGLLSFSWYLIHETVGMSLLATFNQFLPAWLTLVLVLVTTFCIAVVFANLFEWRFRKPVEAFATAVLNWIGSRLTAPGLKARAATPSQP